MNGEKTVTLELTPLEAMYLFDLTELVDEETIGNLFGDEGVQHLRRLYKKTKTLHDKMRDRGHMQSGPSHSNPRHAANKRRLMR